VLFQIRDNILSEGKFTWIDSHFARYFFIWGRGAIAPRFLGSMPLNVSDYLLHLIVVAVFRKDTALI